MHSDSYLRRTPTDHKSRKERIDPAHDQRLGNHHHHVSLQHAHHLLHASWVGHRVGRRLSPVVRVLEERAVAEPSDQVVLAHLEGVTVQNSASIIAQVNTTEKSMALARCSEGGGGFRGGVH